MTMREESLTRLASGQVFDVLILGGGVNGVAVLRDLALNGVSALLIDRSDFCKGASSASSRMAHGGLRYLENREFKLVAESTRERNLLLKHAPHFTEPLEVVVPLQTYFHGLLGSIARFLGFETKAARLSAVGLKGALYIYEFLGRVEKALPPHRALFTRDSFPAHLARRYRAVISYFDARIRNPEALILEMLEEALGDNPRAACLNHVHWSRSEAGQIEIEDKVSGRRFTLAPRVIVNASGAWVDQVNASLGLATGYIRPVKGAHLLIRHDELFRRMAGRAFYFDDGAGRMVICYPLDRTILLGTTEIQVRNPDDENIARDEIDYLIGALSKLFDDIAIDRGHIVAMTTGIRPLQSGGDEKSANQANRDHRIADDHLGLTPVLSLIGGKWTTFRAFAEQSADRILNILHVERRVSTRRRDYPGARGIQRGADGLQAFAARLERDFTLPAQRAVDLTRRYGAVAQRVAGHCAAGPDSPLESLPDFTEREIDWLVQHRAAVFLDDLLLRRTQLVLDGRCTQAVVRELGVLLARLRKLDPSWGEAEAVRCLAMETILPFSASEGKEHG